MNFVPGRFYRTRDGYKCVFIGTNPLADDPGGLCVFGLNCGDTFAVYENGLQFHGVDSRWDIIGEWQEPVTVKTYIVAVVYPDGSTSRSYYTSRSGAEQWAETLCKRGLRCGISESETVVP